MIADFRHRGLERFFLTGSKAGIQPAHAVRLRLQLTRLNAATRPEDINVPGWRLHRLRGARAGLWSVEVSGNWRMTFSFLEGNATDADYLDYH